MRWVFDARALVMAAHPLYADVGSPTRHQSTALPPAILDDRRGLEGVPPPIRAWTVGGVRVASLRSDPPRQGIAPCVLGTAAQEGPTLVGAVDMARLRLELGARVFQSSMR